MLFAAGDEEAVLLREDLVKHVGPRPWTWEKDVFLIFASFLPQN